MAQLRKFWSFWLDEIFPLVLHGLLENPPLMLLPYRVGDSLILITVPSFTRPLVKDTATQLFASFPTLLSTNIECKTLRYIDHRSGNTSLQQPILNRNGWSQNQTYCKENLEGQSQGPVFVIPYASTHLWFKHTVICSTLSSAPSWGPYCRSQTALEWALQAIPRTAHWVSCGFASLVWWSQILLCSI